MYSPEFKKNEVMLQNTSDGPLARQPGPTYKSIGHECRLSAISTPVAFPKHTIIKKMQNQKSSQYSSAFLCTKTYPENTRQLLGILFNTHI